MATAASKRGQHLTSEKASELARKRWENKTGRSPSVRVSIPPDLLAAIEASGRGRSELIVELLRAWADGQK